MHLQQMLPVGLHLLMTFVRIDFIQAVSCGIFQGSQDVFGRVLAGGIDLDLFSCYPIDAAGLWTPGHIGFIEEKQASTALGYDNPGNLQALQLGVGDN